jgi:uncharacterized protein (DUF433 family)
METRSWEEGRYPTWHKHVDYILGDNPRRVRGQAIMRRGGMPVWAVMGFYFLFEKDRAATLKAYYSQLTSDELDAVLDFYRDNPEAIDQKLYEIAN